MRIMTKEEAQAFVHNNTIKEDDCWIWKWKLFRTLPSINGFCSPAKISYDAFVKTPEHHTMTSTCSNKFCINPDHLFDGDLANCPLHDEQSFKKFVHSNVTIHPNGCWIWNNKAKTLPKLNAALNGTTSLLMATFMVFKQAHPIHPMIGRSCTESKCVNPDHLLDGETYRYGCHSADKLKEFIKDNSSVVDSGCWEWNHKRGPLGYGFFPKGLRRGTDLPYGAHRVSYILFNGDFDRDKDVCHSCDNPPCVNPAHLWIGTQTDNHNDMVAKNRQRGTPGIENNKAKLADSQVIEIRKSKERTSDLSKRFGISDNQIRRIQLGRNWKHLILDQEEGIRNGIH